MLTLYKRSERWSILLALTLEGYMDYIIFQGAFTSELFKAFVEHKVLPNCTPYLGPRLIIILDNASVYKLKRLQELCDQAGVILEFLLPYSPDLNPIKATFKDLKAWIKRNHVLAVSFESFDRFLEFAISQVCGVHAEGHFKRAGYIVE